MVVPPFHTPKWSIFSRKTPWVLLGKPTILGNPPKKNTFTTHHLRIRGVVIISGGEKLGSSVMDPWIRTFAKKNGKTTVQSVHQQKNNKNHNTNQVMIQFEDICTNKYLNIIRYQPYLTNLDGDHLSIGGLKSLTFEYLVVNWTTTLLGAITYPVPATWVVLRYEKIHPFFWKCQEKPRKVEDNGVFMTWHRKESSGSDPIFVIPEVPFSQINISFMEISPYVPCALSFPEKIMAFLLLEVSHEWSCKRCDQCFGVAFFSNVFYSKLLGWPRWSWKNGPQNQNEKKNTYCYWAPRFFQVLVYNVVFFEPIPVTGWNVFV